MYLFVVTGRNCGKTYAERCLTSIRAQRGKWRCVVVDDASTDDTGDVIRANTFGDTRFTVHTNLERLGPVENQWGAWMTSNLSDDDVVVWVDLDDRLAHPRVLQTLDRYYREGALVTYGSYVPDPADPGCKPARAIPPLVLRRGTIRDYARRQGIPFNHLRSVSWRVLKHIGELDLQDSDGRWWPTSADAAVMFPAIELAGERARFVDEVLYVYSTDNPTSEWRQHLRTVQATHKQLKARPARRPIPMPVIPRGATLR